MRTKNFYVPSQKATEHLNIPEFTESLLEAEDRFLKYLAEHRADVLNDFMEGITSRYKSETPDGYNPFSSLDLSNVKADLEILKDVPDLLETCVDYYLTLLNIPEIYAWEPQELELVLLDIDRAWVKTHYYRASLMSELIGREEAIKYLKKYHDFKGAEHSETKRFENITSLYEAYGNGKGIPEGDAVGLTYALINEGMVAFREEICRPHGALKEFDDHEFIFLSSCYEDYARIELWNENFVLTRGCTRRTIQPVILAYMTLELFPKLNIPQGSFMKNSVGICKWSF